MVIVQGNSFCKLAEFTDFERKLVEHSLTYSDEAKEKQINHLRRALQKAQFRRQFRKVAYLAGAIEKLGEFNVCLLNKDNTFPAGILFKVKELYDKALKDPRYSGKLNKLVVKDERSKPEPYNLFRWNNKPPEMRYYQKECLDLAMLHNRGTFEVCVGGGKTLIAANIIKETGVNTLFVVPSTALSQQTFNVFSSYFGKNNVQQLTTKDVKANKKFKPIIISTIQTLNSLVKQNLVEKVANHIHSLMIDEAHHGASDSYLNLLPYLNEVYYRFNFSGTYTRNDGRIMELWGVCDQKLYKYSSAKATEDKFLTPVEFKIKKIKGTDEDNYNNEYHKNYSSSSFLSKVVEEVKTIPTDKQILILVDRKDLVGQQIHDFLTIAKIESSYVTGDNNKKELTDAMEDFNDKKIKILIASTVLGEGADIRSTDYLILARGGKSEIAITQAIGRAVRLYPGKNVATVIDFEWEGTRWLGKHSLLRMETYVEEFNGKIIRT
jgi:superfamily II DNA or RNA helicase